jgi:hypothetical protein
MLIPDLELLTEVNNILREIMCDNVSSQPMIVTHVIHENTEYEQQRYGIVATKGMKTKDYFFNNPDTEVANPVVYYSHVKMGFVGALIKEIQVFPIKGIINVVEVSYVNNCQPLFSIERTIDIGACKLNSKILK